MTEINITEPKVTINVYEGNYTPDTHMVDYEAEPLESLPPVEEPRPDMAPLATMVLDYCEQCETRDGRSPGNAVCVECRFVGIYREARRVFKA